MRKATGNMYKFIDYTWNPIKGKCMHNCKYCYMKQWGIQKDIRIDETELKVELGRNNYIFVCSGTDMFANNVPDAWIMKVLFHCSRYNNKYLFQSKNPERFLCFTFPSYTIFGTTIESNRDYPDISKAPKIHDRVKSMIKLRDLNYRTMVTIEPILDFDVGEMVVIINNIHPEWVNIGVDSKNHNLPEPSWNKIIELKYALSEFTKVTLKNNIYRLKK